jgi:hypothetical protein
MNLTNKTLVILASMAIVSLFASIIYASMNGNFWLEGGNIIDMPWGITMLIDLYIGLLIFSTWVFLRESSKLIACLWIITFLFMGNLITCLYLLLNINKIAMHKFSTGARL